MTSEKEPYVSVSTLNVKKIYHDRLDKTSDLDAKILLKNKLLKCIFPDPYYRIVSHKAISSIFYCMVFPEKP